MAQTYLYGYGSGPYGASTTRRTREYICLQSQYQKVDPELMRRLFGLADAVIAGGSDYGFGSGWRSSAQQLSLFLSRYTKVAPGTGGTYYDIAPPYEQYSGWYKHTSGATAAPPGRSYHESTTNGGTGYALALDMVGDHTRGNPLAADYGVKHFANINSEPWHYQPVEIPNARSAYVNHFEDPRQWPLPNDTPPSEFDNMSIHDPVRILDTRISGKAGYNQTFPVRPHGLTPAGADVILNLTALQAAEPTHFTLWSGDGPVPTASQINLAPGDASPKNGFTIVPVRADGTFSVFSLKPAHLIIDQIGFIAKP